MVMVEDVGGYRADEGEIMKLDLWRILWRVLGLISSCMIVAESICTAS